MKEHKNIYKNIYIKNPGIKIKKILVPKVPLVKKKIVEKLTFKKERKKVDAVLRASFRFGNTFVNIGDIEGKTIFKLSAGSLKIKPLKKGSTFAAYTLGEIVAKRLIHCNIHSIDFEVNGFGKGRRAFFRAVRNTAPRIKILTMIIKPKVPHNGCRPPKVRRL